MSLRLLHSVLAVSSASLLVSCAEPQARSETFKTIPVDEIWAANTVNFALKTAGNQQFVAYYDAERMMTVASRDLGSSEWTKQTLPNRLHWDSHNYVSLGIDPEGYLHVSGNMHNDPLVYFRSERPYDVTSLVEINRMVDSQEEAVTYPIFFNNKAGDLLYSYRIGSSGDGNILINRFLPETMTWERYLDKPLFAGVTETESRSAYHQFTQDEEGNLHFAWIWRWTPKVETSHDICYATTSDMLNWTNGAGEPVELPFRPDDANLTVDPVPTKGGAHNGRVKIIIDQDQQPIIGYVKYDEAGQTQAYLARVKDGKWMIKQISDWDFRWQFTGGGDGMTIGGRITFEGISPEGLLVVNWETEKGDSGQYVLDSKTLEHSDRPHTLAPLLPSNAKERMTDNPKLKVNIMHDSGKSADDRRYILKWESAGRTFFYRGPGEEPEGPITQLNLIEY